MAGDERWLPIPGHPDYQVSDLGRVRGKLGRILAERKLDHGYMVVGLYSEGRQRMHRVHRLVAKAFIPNPEEKSEVNHIDGDRTNNNVSNLEWVTPRENYAHAAARGLHSAETNPNRLMSISPAVRAESVRLAKEGQSFAAIARQLGIDRTSVRRMVKGRPLQKYIPRPGVYRSKETRAAARERRLAKLAQSDIRTPQALSTLSTETGEKA